MNKAEKILAIILGILFGAALSLIIGLALIELQDQNRLLREQNRILRASSTCIGRELMHKNIEFEKLRQANPDQPTPQSHEHDK